MLSAIKRINTRVLWAPSKIRDLSNAASKPPRRRKSVAAKKIPLQSHVDIGVDPPLSLAIKEGVLKEKSLNVSLEETAKPTVLPKVQPQDISKKLRMDPSHSNREPIMNIQEYSFILSLVEEEPVDSHPLLKVVDFSNLSSASEIPLHTNFHRFLSSLRLCHKFKFACEVIQSRLNTLSAPALLEAARLLANAEMHRRCSLRSHSSRTEEFGDTVSLAGSLRDQLKGLRLPKSMSITIHSLLDYVTDPNHAVSTFSKEAFKHSIYRQEIHQNLACAALESEQWPIFKLIMESCPLSAHYSPYLVFHIVDFVIRNPKRKLDVVEWYMNALSQERQPLSQLQWSKYTSSILKVCGSQANPVNVTKQGTLSTLSGKTLPFSVPKEEPIDELDFNCLKADLNNMLNELCRGSGSVTKKEVEGMRRCIRSWSRAHEKAIIIDSLNVFHGALKGLEPLLRITNRLAAEYENAVLVTRPFLVEKLKNVRWRGQVRVFSCSTLSEDDLLVLLAAVEWGPNAYVLSDDRFSLHVERARCTGRLSLRDWMRRRMLRFNRQDWQYDELPSYAEFVQKVNPETYFLPVIEETPGISERSSFLVTY